ncbi:MULTISPECIES: hypothetical protein [unclassified Pseudomonas]|uniref:hypothetical protein n=1 Tax=unclassified Pseudomonas TaxID=196821 RepID=UPI000BCDF820|nr:MULTISPECIES: hypothetical protein [unclassified Pseudomonas]PVZ19902.1 hypothetical protein F474_00493 [Pseudomonas sp. URIL14HWK12:I12]PVZ26968.1 hypothetical protein F470_00148 [Pseudomonas sp. URIL14HWK12:I10]PVZ37857.1 hypothetical protein F472_00493 [Pseudomonas sp. URIL14HWK12:I11]SNZ05390.1 hypothetical protein SAMN05660463_00911 [Pseudomonas sp. URIL14HWK12:I9]
MSGERSERQAAWHALLENPRNCPDLEAWRLRLHGMTAGMQAAGEIDALEAFDLRELADAAYGFFLEQRIDEELRYPGRARI